MDQKEFILQLKVQLSGMPQSEIDDIVRDQEELIRDGVSAGRTEAAVIEGLGSPIELARNIKASYKIGKAQDEIQLSKQMRGAFGAVGALLVLAPFNIIFVLGPFCGVMGLLFGGWALSLGLGVAAIAALIVFLVQAVFVTAVLSAKLASLFLFLGGLGLAVLLLVAMYHVTRIFLQLTLKYLMWNLNFIKKQVVTT
jgi:uncharacterized membrane protein